MESRDFRKKNHVPYQLFVVSRALYIILIYDQGIHSFNLVQNRLERKNSLYVIKTPCTVPATLPTKFTASHTSFNYPNIFLTYTTRRYTISQIYTLKWSEPDR